MKGKKTSNELKAKIIEAKINTNAQGSDIASELGVPERTVNNIIQQDFAEVCRESEIVGNLIDRNNKLQSSADKLLQKLIDAGEDLKPSDLVSVRESAFKQNQLLQGKNTEQIGVVAISDEEQKKLLSVIGK